MASQLAETIFTKHLGQDLGEGGITRIIDVELQEVREVLADCIAAFPESAEGEQRARAAQCASALMERLNVR